MLFAVAGNTHQLQLQLAHVVISLVILEPHLSRRSLARPDERTHRALRSTRPTALGAALSRGKPLSPSSVSELLSREHPRTRWGTRPVPRRSIESELPLPRCDARRHRRCIAAGPMKGFTVSAPRSAGPRIVSRCAGTEDKYTERETRRGRGEREKERESAWRRRAVWYDALEDLWETVRLGTAKRPSIDEARLV